MTTQRRTPTVWAVQLAGKWGGGRTVTVTAKTNVTARKRALELARLDERVTDIRPARP